jgi:hypothetical protein
MFSDFGICKIVVGFSGKVRFMEFVSEIIMTNEQAAMTNKKISPLHLPGRTE